MQLVGVQMNWKELHFGMWEALLMGVSANADKPGNVSTVSECTLM